MLKVVDLPFTGTLTSSTARIRLLQRTLLASTSTDDNHLTVSDPRPCDGILQVEEHIRQIDLRRIEWLADNVPVIALWQGYAVQQSVHKRMTNFRHTTLSLALHSSAPSKPS